MSLNSDKYNFEDFTRDNFKKLIREAKKNYKFITYDEIELNKEKKIILLRHDVDFSVHSAFKLAQIEKEENVKATFFIWLQSKFYNPFEKEIFQKIKSIVEMGHPIGIHLDCEFHSLNNEEEIEKVLQFEKQTLENLFETSISVFSFHNPNAEVLKNTNEKYLGLINTYSSYFRNNVFYCSDSNGYWRFHRLDDVIKEAKNDKLQILLHPEWWTEEIMSPKEKVWRSINSRAENNINWYKNTLENHGRENIDW